ncbi:transposase [Priestia megaterium]|nr:transposase [Priestia megaterium]
MTKAATPSFVLTVDMNINTHSQMLIERDLEVCRVLYNACLSELLKRERQMKRTKSYQKIKRCLRVVSQKLSYSIEKKNENKSKHYQEQKENLLNALFALQQTFELTEYGMHEYIIPMRKHFGNTLNSAIAQKMATRAWNTFYKKLNGKAKRVQFVKRNEMRSFEGKANTSGWRYRNRTIVNGKTIISLRIKEQDMYLQEALSMIENEAFFSYTTKQGGVKQAVTKVKYVRIVKRLIRGKIRYVAQLTVQGSPPPKRNRDGSFKYSIGKGRVGGDLGVSSVAIVGENDVLLCTLAKEVKNVSRDIRLLQRKMDRSKRASNPTNYCEDGTIKKGKKTWTFSRRYQLLRSQVRELHRKQAAIRKNSHQRLANQLLSFGDEHYWEDMHIQGLQKRAKKTEKSEKTGTFKRKKRFGKSIGHRAPALFLTILEQKIRAQGGTFQKVNTWTFKASQYDHNSNDYQKKELKNRWHVFEDGTRVQRDLYSAFLLKNSNKTRTKPQRKRCLETFDRFKHLHHEHVSMLEGQEQMVLNSGICVKEKNATVVA